MKPKRLKSHKTAESKLSESWIFWLVLETIYDSAWGFVFFTFAYYAFDRSIIRAAILSVTIVVVSNLRSSFIQHKPPYSKLYRMPRLKIDGMVVEKHTYIYPLTSFFREWVIFNTLDGEQIKAYITEPFNSRKRENLQTFDADDKGVLHYRQGKKHKYFEYFVLDIYASEN